MPIIALIFAVAGLTWASSPACAQIVGCGLVIAVSYALGHEFWHVHLGPLPVTLDRIFLVALLGVLAFQRQEASLRFAG